MAVLPFAEYRPDLNDLNAAYTSSILNVLPRADGYGPFTGPNVFSGGLADACRGLFFARNSDGSVKVFVGTATRLYALDNTSLTWTDVSSGGSAYTSVSKTANWQFAQFNDYVVAVQANADPQVFQLGVSSAFSALSGSPPRAAYVTVVNRFLVLSGLSSYPRRVQWSGLNAITTWTSGTTYSDYQDLPDGGNTTRVVGGEFGIIFQDSAIRRMIYSPGSDIVFQIDKIAKDIGDAAPYGVTEADGKAYLYTTRGFYVVSGDGGLQPIGRERVDRTFAAEADMNFPQYVQGTADPKRNMVWWAYKHVADNVTYWTRMLGYDYVLDKWTHVEQSGEYLAGLARPGLTMESLDTIGSLAIANVTNNGSGAIRITVSSTTGMTTGDRKTIGSVGGVTAANNTSSNPYWTITVISSTTFDLQGSTFSGVYTSGGYVAGSIESLGITSLDDISAATLAQFAMIDTSHALNYFTGDTLEATLETSEQSGVGRRMFVSGFYPITDSADASGSIGRRENLYDTSSYTTAQSVNAQGFIPARADTRHARAKITIPAAATWTFATGVDPDVTAGGKR